MEWGIITALLLILGVIVYEDFRERSIHWFLVPGLAALLIALSVLRMGWLEMLNITTWNAVFLCVQGAGLILYFAFKHRRYTPVVDRYIGLGDILFLLAITPAFGQWNFILFILSGIAIALLIFVLLQAFRPASDLTVPLAGILAAYLGLVLVLEQVGVIPGLYEQQFIQDWGLI